MSGELARRRSVSDVVNHLRSTTEPHAKRLRTNGPISLSNEWAFPTSATENNDDKLDSESTVSTTIVAPPTTEEKEEVECGICLEPIVEQGVLNCCEHLFCFACVFKWSRRANLCPLCRRRFSQIVKKKPGQSTPNVRSRKRGDSVRIRKKDLGSRRSEDEEEEEEEQERIRNLLTRRRRTDVPSAFIVVDDIDHTPDVQWIPSFEISDDEGPHPASDQGEVVEVGDPSPETGRVNTVPEVQWSAEIIDLTNGDQTDTRPSPRPLNHWTSRNIFGDDEILDVTPSAPASFSFPMMLPHPHPHPLPLFSAPMMPPHPTAGYPMSPYSLPPIRAILQDGPSNLFDPVPARRSYSRSRRRRASPENVIEIDLDAPSPITTTTTNVPTETSTTTTTTPTPPSTTSTTSTTAATGDPPQTVVLSLDEDDSWLNQSVL